MAAPNRRQFGQGRKAGEAAPLTALDKKTLGNAMQGGLLPCIVCRLRG